MKFSILSIILSVFFLISCRKSKIDEGLINNPSTPVSNYILKDSCSYIVDGTTFNCNVLDGLGYSVSGTNFNLITSTWAPTDTALYTERFSLHNKYDFSASIEMNFSEKRILNKIAPSSPIFAFPSHPNDSTFYKIRSFDFATDFKRFQNKEGVAFKVLNRKPTFSEWLYSYNPKLAQLTTTISDTCQNNSTFKIVKTFKLNDLNYVEAIFSANVYTENEVEKKLTNGFIRFSYF